MQRRYDFDPLFATQTFILERERLATRTHLARLARQNGGTSHHGWLRFRAIRLRSVLVNRRTVPPAGLSTAEGGRHPEQLVQRA